MNDPSTELVHTEDCGQVSINISKPGITKGQHWHNSKWELFIVVAGHGLIQERNINTGKMVEFEVSGGKIEAIHMIPGWTHNIINLSDTEIVAVCVDGSNASRSAFSGMTEAFYRQLPVILITLGNSLDYTMELKDVVLGHYLVKDAKEILNFANYKLPAHIELGEEIIIDTEVESLKLQEALMEAVSEKDYLYFSPRFQTKEKDFMCKCISGGMSRCKDGTLSNVLGASLAQKRRRYIGVVTEEEFLHDMNTLGNIHANKDLFFIVISQKFEKMIGDYARTLNYEVICEAEDNICGTSLKRLFENGKQTIFIMLKK